MSEISSEKANPLLPHWYCVRTHPKHEHIAEAHLRRSGTTAIYCPRIRYRRTTRSGWKWFEESLFPCYLFAKFHFESAYRQVQLTPGVSKIVQFASVPEPVPENTIIELQKHYESGKVLLIPNEPVPGDVVEIAEGPFQGLEVMVHKVLPAKERVQILMNILGSDKPVEIAASSILPRGNPLLKKTAPHIK